MTLLSTRGVSSNNSPDDELALCMTHLHEAEQARESMFLFPHGKRREAMEEPREQSEQIQHTEPGRGVQRHYYQSLRDHEQTMMVHHRCLMEHHQFLLDHLQTVQALYLVVLDSQQTRRGQQLSIDQQMYQRALRNHSRLVENHRQMLEEQRQMREKCPHKPEPE